MEVSGLDKAEGLLLGAFGLSLVDGIMTIPYWHLEGNPAVLALGPGGMMLVKIVVGLTAVVIYSLTLKGTRYAWVGKASGIGLCTIYAVVVVTNVAVLIA